MGITPETWVKAILTLPRRHFVWSLVLVAAAFGITVAAGFLWIRHGLPDFLLLPLSTVTFLTSQAALFALVGPFLRDKKRDAQPSSPNENWFGLAKPILSDLSEWLFAALLIELGWLTFWATALVPWLEHLELDEFSRFTLLLPLPFLLFPLVQVFMSRGFGKIRRPEHQLQAMLRTWVVPLRHFRFHHEPYRRDTNPVNFLGREELAAEFLALLNNSQNSSGSYLVTGYRGAGKTSLVKKVLHDYADGRHGPSLRGRFDLLGDWGMRIGNFLVRRWGWWVLTRHRREARRTSQQRREGRPAPRFLWPPGTWFLVLMRVVPWLLVPVFLMTVFFTSPHGTFFGRLPNWGIAALTLLVAVLWRLFLYHRLALLYPPNWWRWLLRPVATIHINLGNERLEPRKVLFGLVHILRAKYRAPFRPFSFATWIRVSVSLLLTLLFSIALYDLFKVPNTLMHVMLQGAIFDSYVVDGEMARRVEEQASQPPASRLEKSSNSAGALMWPEGDARWQTCHQIRIDRVPSTCPEQNCKTRDAEEYLLRVMPLAPLFEQPSCRAASREPAPEAVGALVGEFVDTAKPPEPEQVLALLAREGFGPAREYPLSKQDATSFALGLQLDPPLLGASMADPSAPRPRLIDRARMLCAGLPTSELTLLQSAYCAIDAWIVGLYCQDPQGPDAQCSIWPEANRAESRPADEASESGVFHLPQWTHDAFLGIARQIERLAQNMTGVTSTPDEQSYLNAPHIYHILFFFIVFAVARSLVGYFGRARVANMLNAARERIVATDTVEVGGGGGIWGLSGRRERKYDPLDVRQTEALILDILEANRRVPVFLPRADIVFVFDELDKINPVKSELMEEADVHRGRSLNEAVRRRKVEVEELLSNLKNLITVAPCRFIFIAGREMMDANLADQSANSHLYSSLFDKVIYVPSLLTDPSDDNNEDISSMVEQYLCRRLLPTSIAYYLQWEIDEKNKARLDENEELERDPERLSQIKARLRANQESSYRCWTLDVYARYLAAIHEDELQDEHPPQKPEGDTQEPDGDTQKPDGDTQKPKGDSQKPKDDSQKPKGDRGPMLPRADQELICLLQDFVYYLTYRSGGNPKKLALHLENFVSPLPDDFLYDRARYRRPGAPILPTTNFLVKLTPEAQYEIQLISQVFMLFHGDLSALIRKYGDKLAVATFSILDYLLKFHSQGFNTRDIERMPDFLDINRAPALPELVRLLLERLLVPNLRRVDNGIYEYRFLLHFQREVVYISQFSELELAAFNFTLDESIAIKKHFRDFRDEQIRLRKEMAPVLWPASVEPLPEERRGGAYSLPYIDAILGDLHNLDHEFDQALTEYRGALDAAEPSLAYLLRERDDEGARVEVANPPFGQFLVYFRTLLKQGLIYERRHQYPDASSCYTQARVLVERMRARWKGEAPFSDTEGQIYLFAQPYICLAFLCAKRDSAPIQALAHLDAAEQQFRMWQARASDNGYGTQDDSASTQPAETPARIAGRLERFSQLGVRLELRRGDLLLFRSSPARAAGCYAAAAWTLAKELIQRAGSAETDSSHGYVSPAHLLGYALSGLGDAVAAMDLEQVTRSLPQGCSLCDEPAADKPETRPCRKPDADWLSCKLIKGLRTAREWQDEYNTRCAGPRRRRPTAHEDGEGSANPTSLFASLDTFFEAKLRDVDLNEPNGRADEDFDIEAFRGHAAAFYVAASRVYRCGGKPSEASLSLWKAVYLFAFGFSYLPEEAAFFDEEIAPKADKLLFKRLWRNKDDLWKRNPNQLHADATAAFHWAYGAQRERLGKLLVKEPSLLKWIAPPLSQSAIVLGAYWNSRRIDSKTLCANEYAKEPGNRKVQEVSIRYMGAFPVYPRILAAFLKGRWLFRQAFRLADVTGKTTKMPVQELPFDLLEKIRASELDKREGQREPVPLVALNPDTFCPEETRRPSQTPNDDADRTEQAVDAARYALRYFIDAIEDGEAYEGGLEMLNPPLGFVYYMLWLTLRVLGETGESERIKGPIEHSAEFKGERQRFFQLDYARVKAEATLRELLARHGQGEKFFAYAGQYYYLTDSFSDPFVNGLWAVDCGLVPIATKMLRCLYLPTECDTTAPPKPAGSGDDAMS